MNHVTVTYAVTVNCATHGQQERLLPYRPAFGAKVRCPKCGGKAPVVDVRPAMAEAQAEKGS